MANHNDLGFVEDHSDLGFKEDSAPSNKPAPGKDILQAAVEGPIASKLTKVGFGEPKFSQEAPTPPAPDQLTLPSPTQYPEILSTEPNMPKPRPPEPGPVPQQIQPQIPQNVQSLADMKPHELEDFFKARLGRARRDVGSNVVQEPMSKLEELLQPTKMSVPVDKAQNAGVDLGDLVSQQSSQGPINQVRVPGQQALELKQQLDKPIYRPQDTYSVPSTVIKQQEARKELADYMRGQIYDAGGQPLLEQAQPGVKTSKLLQRGENTFAPNMMKAAPGSKSESVLSRAESMGAGPLTQESQDYKEALKLQQGKPTRYSKEADMQSKQAMDQYNAQEAAKKQQFKVDQSNYNEAKKPLEDQADFLQKQKEAIQKQERDSLADAAKQKEVEYVAKQKAYETAKKEFEAAAENRRVLPTLGKAAARLAEGSPLKAGGALLQAGRAGLGGIGRMAAKVAGPIGLAMTAKDIYDAVAHPENSMQAEVASDNPDFMGKKIPSDAEEEQQKIAALKKLLGK